MLAGSIFLAFVAALILFGLLAMYRESLAKASSKHQLAVREMQPPQDTTELLPASSVESTPSITEHTTELLMAEEKGPQTRRGRS